MNLIGPIFQWRGVHKRLFHWRWLLCPLPCPFASKPGQNARPHLQVKCKHHVVTPSSHLAIHATTTHPDCTHTHKRPPSSQDFRTVVLSNFEKYVPLHSTNSGPHCISREYYSSRRDQVERRKGGTFLKSNKNFLTIRHLIKGENGLRGNCM